MVLQYGKMVDNQSSKNSLPLTTNEQDMGFKFRIAKTGKKPVLT